MIRKEIEIDGRLVPFKASATVPRLYRAMFQRDIFRDFMKLEKTVKGKKKILHLRFWKSLRMFPTLWQNMQTLPNRIHRKNGWISLIHFRFMRSFRSSWIFGISIYRPM